MTLTIVITTYNRISLLRRLLDSLMDQTIASEEFEIIVVDNNSTDGTVEWIKKSKLFEARKMQFVQEKTQGVSIARNSGLKLASGEYISFLDDDVTVRNNWMAAVFQIINKHKPDFFGGVVHPSYEEQPPKWFDDKFEIREHYPESGWLPAYTYLSINYVARRACLNKIGGFNIDIGPKGAKFQYGEDSDLIARLYQKGYLAYYNREMIVDHFVPKRKMTLSYVLNRKIELGMSYAVLEHKFHNAQTSPEEALSNLLGIVKSLTTGLAEINGSFNSENDDFSLSLDRLLNTCYAIGYSIRSYELAAEDRTLIDKIRDLNISKLIKSIS